MYEEEITVPLIFWAADGRLRGQPLRNTARQIDIAPTIADLMGLTDDDYAVQGRSLLADGPDETAYVVSFFAGVSMAMVRGTEKVIYFPSNGQVLRFDLHRDPDEKSPQPLQDKEREDLIRKFRSFQAFQRRLFE